MPSSPSPSSSTQLLLCLILTILCHQSDSLSSPSPKIRRTIQNLLSISTHLQNPDLYSPDWANSCAVVTAPSKKDGDFCVIASRNVKKGELVTLYPVHAIGLKSHKIENNFVDRGMGAGVGVGGVAIGKKKNVKKKSMKQRIKRNKERFLEDYSYLFHDSKWDFDTTLPKMKVHQNEVQIPLSLSPSSPRAGSSSSSILGVNPAIAQLGLESDLYIQSHPSRKLLPGWYGHLIATKSTSSSRKSMKTQEAFNCVLVPIPCSTPLCGIVATRDIEKGEQFFRQIVDNKTKDEENDTSTSSQEEMVSQFVKEVVRRYTGEISELGSYYKMAYENDQEGEGGADDNSLQDEKLSFHSINESYPDLTKLHSDPDIYIIPNFLSSDECERIVAKSSPHLMPCLVKAESSGSVLVDPEIRTSTNANVPRKEVPTLTKKITDLMNCSEEQLETYQVLKYEKGQEFKSHTDGFEGPVTACGFFQSGRIATLFCYLNDVEEGGKTVFNKVGIDIIPQKGTAVIHFPMSLNLKEGQRTEHQGSVAVDDKWLLTTWIWKDHRIDERYREDKLQALSDDVI